MYVTKETIWEAKSNLHIAGRNINYPCPMENSVEIHQNTKSEPTVWPSNSSPEDLLRKEKNIHRELCHTCIHAAHFGIPQTWKQLRCPVIDEQQRRSWSMYIKDLLVEILLFRSPFTEGLYGPLFINQSTCWKAHIHTHCPSKGSSYLVGICIA